MPVLLPLMPASGTPPTTAVFTAMVPWVMVSVIVSVRPLASASATLMPVMTLVVLSVAVCAPGTAFTGGWFTPGVANTTSSYWLAP